MLRRRDEKPPELSDDPSEEELNEYYQRMFAYLTKAERLRIKGEDDEYLKSLEKMSDEHLGIGKGKRKRAAC